MARADRSGDRDQVVRALELERTVGRKGFSHTVGVGLGQLPLAG